MTGAKRRIVGSLGRVPRRRRKNAVKASGISMHRGRRSRQEGRGDTGLSQWTWSYNMVARRALRVERERASRCVYWNGDPISLEAGEITVAETGAAALGASLTRF